jgi:protein O-GlcNAc transferase
MQDAVRHHRAGELRQAEALYRQVLLADPNHPDALHYLGLLAHQAGQHGPAWDLMRRAIAVSPKSAKYYCNAAPVLLALGQLDEAVNLCRQAISLRPDYPEALNNLGAALRQKQLWTEAIACCRRALNLRPDYAEAHHNLGLALSQTGQLDEAVGAFRSAIGHRPKYVEAVNQLGLALKRLGQPEQAMSYYRQALALDPDAADALNNLGIALQERGEFEEAIACARRSAGLKPTSAAAHNNLGVALKNSGRLDEAIDCYKRAAELEPASAEIQSNLGVALRDKGRLDESIDCFRRAVTLNSSDVEALSNLGTGLKDAGLVSEAIDCYRRAIAIRPAFSVASNLIYTLHFDPTCTPQQLWAEQVRWEQTYARPLETQIEAHANDRSADRTSTSSVESRLRVGYISPDWREHPIGRFMLPLLSNHDHERFEIYCYSDLARPDALTERLRELADVWRNTAGLPDERVAHLIREDRIDILVDLTMHMAGTRLLSFACKPAPVQVTYLAYCGTTGLRTIDYRLTDPYLDPLGDEERFYSERSMRLRSYWCYEPPDGAPEVQPPPAQSAGHVTFGCLNNFCKVSPESLATWCSLLRAVPGSRLVVHAAEGAHRERLRQRASSEGVAPERIEFVGTLPVAQYLEQYHRIDIALDPFPYPGGTTSCDALWMGVPVVTLPGTTAISRGGLSILSNLQLPDLVAGSQDEYVRIAAGLAAALPRLADLRSTLRERMRASPLMDGPGFARDVEAAYRRMWQEWIGSSIQK